MAARTGSRRKRESALAPPGFAVDALQVGQDYPSRSLMNAPHFFRNILLWTLAIFGPATLHAQTLVQWTGGGANNHYYQLVLAPAGITWAAANTAAQATGGYLVTFASAAENSFVYTNLAATQSSAWFIDGSGNGEGPWIGGQQIIFTSEPAGGWVWDSGETWSYTNWSSGEPNNFGGIEEKAVFFGPATLMGSVWNDVPASSTMNAYIIEFNTSPIPEPATMAMLLGLGAVVAVAARRKFFLTLRRLVA